VEDDSVRQRGLSTYERVFGHPRSTEGIDGLAELTIDHLFANVWSRLELCLRDRSMITVALLAALGRDDELRVHLQGAANQGISTIEIEEIMIHVAHYAGWPAGHHGLAVAKAVDNENSSGGS
jgi:4-carboxymuconolactone decarboxylase